MPRRNESGREGTPTSFNAALHAHASTTSDETRGGRFYLREQTIRTLRDLVCFLEAHEEGLVLLDFLKVDGEKSDAAGMGWERSGKGRSHPESRNEIVGVWFSIKIKVLPFLAVLKNTRVWCILNTLRVEGSATQLLQLP